MPAMPLGSKEKMLTHEMIAPAPDFLYFELDLFPR